STTQSPLPSNQRSSSPTVRCRWVAAFSLGDLAACARIEPAAPPPSAETAEPLVRVGVVTGLSAVNLGGGGPLLLSGPDAGGLTELPAGIIAQVNSTPGGVRARWAGGSAGTVPA